MRTLLTVLTIVVIGVFCVGFSNAQIPYTDDTVLWQITDSTSATSTGRTIFKTVGNLNTISGISSKSNLIYSITVDNLTTANKITIYDASSYSDATLNNQILGEYEYGNNTCVVRGIGVKQFFAGQAIAGSAGLGGRGYIILGDTGFTFDFTAPDGKPLNLKKGLHIDGTDGVAPYTIQIRYRRE